MAEQYMFESLKSRAYDLDIPRIKSTDYQDITENIKYPLFDWQRASIEHFLTFQKIKEAEQNTDATHLMFNMATGTGKTLVMASLLLYYYKQGYRNFIFFVNQNTLVGKTESNLIDPTHNKYQYNQTIVIDDKTVNIRKVDTFSNQTDDVEIIFTTIHKLHNAVYLVKENAIFLDDLLKRDLVLLGDEAHNLNATTKKSKGVQTQLELFTELKDGASEEDIERSWENTVINRILKRDGVDGEIENRNVLLEFTATGPTNTEVVKKYQDKIIYKFDLKDFLKAGYTKEINLVTSSFDKKKRVLQALLFNWYRQHIATSNGIDLKPVILFRSKYVDQTKDENSQKDYKLFQDIIQNLCVDDFSFLHEFDEKTLFSVTETYLKGQSRIIDIKRYIDEKQIALNEVIEYLKYAFCERNCIITNSKTGTKTKEKTDQETERLLNNLEDKSNHITAIFTVKRLTEGWDVLNLYDIVRMYQGRDEGKDDKGDRKAGQSTVSEVQLIGRGVRYYPFKYEDKIPNKRKFDKDLTNDLRVLEEFYFHSDNDEKYINELKNELKRQELLPDKEKVQLTFDFKAEYHPNLSESPFSQLELFGNERIENPNRRKQKLEKDNFDFEYNVQVFVLKETKVIVDEVNDETRYLSESEEKRTLKLTLNSFQKHIIRKAINIHAKKDKSIFRFEKLKDELSIESIDDIVNNEFLGDFPIKVIVPGHIMEVAEIEPLAQLNILIRFFEKIEIILKEYSNPYIGTEFKKTKFNSYFTEPKTISVVEEPKITGYANELVKKDWYVLDNFYGTSEEVSLMKFIENTIVNFKERFDQVYLLRNEEVYKIYDFKQGRGFMPDFILFLKQKSEQLYYQVFIEPKGSQFRDATGGFIDGKEGWKEEFLKEISEKYSQNSILKAENKEYRLVGLPLYNAAVSNQFKMKISETFGVQV
jgi:type III restriction enzyme